MFLMHDGITYQKDEQRKSCMVVAVSSEKKKITIPAIVNGYTVTGIFDLAFAFVNTFEEITIPSTISTIGENAFMACTNLTSVKMIKPNYTVPIKNSKVLKIKAGVFFGCTSLTSVDFFNKELELADGVFSQCYNLLRLNGRVKVTESNSFWGCQKLRLITFANNINLNLLDLSTLRDLEHLYFVENANLANSVVAQILNKEIIIHCPKSSNLVEFVHLGCVVKIY